MDIVDTTILTITDPQKQDALLRQAADWLKAGQTVIIPTETVYGLAANALDPQAVRGIFTAKGRPGDNPLIVHLADLSMLAELVTEIPPVLRRLGEAFWPGPLTLILPKSDRVPDITSGGLPTVAIRLPSHPIAKRLIQLCGFPLAAPSANRSGSPSPTCARHCIDDMAGRVRGIIDGGVCEVGVESTVVSLTGSVPVLLRPGAVTLEQLQGVIGRVKLHPGVLLPVKADEKVLSPGMKYRHYAPKTKVVLVTGSLERFIEFVNHSNEKIGVLCFDGEQNRIRKPCITYGVREDSLSQAKHLFEALRKIDQYGFDTVYARPPKEDGIGLAVYNRLLRAAAFEQLEI